jgi:hypothetical protein
MLGDDVRTIVASLPQVTMLAVQCDRAVAYVDMLTGGLSCPPAASPLIP